ncbi:ComEA family DNA-binding protein [Chitinophaga deserti]|uniref:ComEA family DNA-binding protein n=1 Tax=Chitinophaga deserti TaxID=2164099 RepID=UPI0013001EEB|nr:helix-hairpin-helix domain-containing protein [Chitinophaga deserti]
MMCLANPVYAIQEEERHTSETQEQLAELDPGSLRENDEQWSLLQKYLHRPLDLNAASAEDLQELGLLLPVQIFQLLEHRKSLGPLAAIFELQAVKGFDLNTIRKLLPYVTAGNPFRQEVPLRTSWTDGTHMLQLRFARTWDGPGAKLFPAAEKAPAYAGSPEKILLRYRYQMGRYAGWGIVLEKDAGESYLRKKGIPIPDHLGFHWVIRRPGLLKTLVLGDYTINMGQGLIQWHGLAPGRSSSVLFLKREGESLRPYAGAGEYYFYRGAAGTLAFRKWELTSWLSVRALDGRVRPVAGEDFDSAGSLMTGGYHRTISEQEARGNIIQHTAGAMLKLRLKTGHAGLNVQGQKFSVPLRAGDELYQRFRFRGNQLLECSFDHAFTWKNVHFFGEVAQSGSGNRAAMQGLLVALSPVLDAGMVWRKGQPGFSGLYGAPFGVTGIAGNEEGCYGALQWKVRNNCVVSGYVDLYRFPWLRYRVGSPSAGTDALLAVQWNPERHAMIQGSYRYAEQAQDMLREGYREMQTLKQAKHQIQLRGEVPLSAAVTWKVRVQAQQVAGASSWMALQQWKWKYGKWKGVFAHTWYSPSPGQAMYLSGQGFAGDGTVSRFSGTGWYCRFQAQRKLGERWSIWGSWQYAQSKEHPQTLNEWREVLGPESRSTVQLQIEYEWGKEK